MTDALDVLRQLGEPALLQRLGGNDPRRTREITLAMYTFLANKPKNTRRNYRHALWQFLELIDWKDIKAVNLADASLFKTALVDRGYKKATTYMHLAAVTSFFRFLTQPVGDGGRQVIERNPFVFVDRKDVKPTPWAHAVAVEWPAFQQMLAATPKDVIGMRDRAVLIFLAHTGRRRAEVARLRMQNLSLDGAKRKYSVEVKGGGDEEWELPDEAYDAMREHWVSSGRLGLLTSDSPVFGLVTSSPLSVGRTLQPAAIWAIVKRAAVRAGLDATKIKTHGLRHMVAHDMDRGGARLQEIQRALGHARADTTSGYLGKLEGPRPALSENLRRARS